MAKRIEPIRWLADNYDPPPHIGAARREVARQDKTGAQTVSRSIRVASATAGS